MFAASVRSIMESTERLCGGNVTLKVINSITSSHMQSEPIIYLVEHGPNGKEWRQARFDRH